MTRKYFVNAYGKNAPVISGRYGDYCRLRGIAFSEKEMRKLGYEIQELTPEQALKLSEKYAVRQLELGKAEHERDMQQRKQSVEICLNCQPLEIGQGNIIWEHITTISKEMLDAYHGCGKGTAYIREGKIIAFHYGYNQPENAPTEDAQVVRVEFSCLQILF